MSGPPLTGAPSRHPRQGQSPPAPGHTKRNRFTIAAYYVVLVLLYAVMFGLWQNEPVPLKLHSTGVAIFAVCLLPLAIWYQQRKTYVPMFEIISLAYCLQFANPIYLQEHRYLTMSKYTQFDPSALALTLYWVLFGTSMMVVSYLLSLKFFSRHVRPVSFRIHPRVEYRYALAAMFGGLAVLSAVVLGLLPPFASGIGGIMRIGICQLYIGLAYLSTRFFQSRIRKDRFWQTQYAWFLLCGIAWACTVGLASAMLEAALIPLAIFTIAKWSVTRKAPVAMILIGLVTFIVMNAVKQEIRSTYSSSGRIGIVQRATIWIDASRQLIGDHFNPDLNYAPEDIVRQSMSRFDFFHQFAYLIQMTPSTVPRYEGETYSYFFYGWIPRMFWPQKPSAQEANITFARDYGVLYESQTTTTMMGVGHLPEAYINFGPFGFGLVMCFHGLFYALLASFFNRSKETIIVAVYLSVSVSFINGIGSDTASMFFTGVQNTFLNIGLLAWARKRNFLGSRRPRASISKKQPLGK